MPIAGRLEDIQGLRESERLTDSYLYKAMNHELMLQKGVDGLEVAVRFGLAGRIEAIEGCIVPKILISR